MTSSKGLEFVINSQNEAYLCGIGTCTDENVVVPSSYNGCMVVGVAEKAFERNDFVKSVTLPFSVESIEKMAFAWCRKLESIRMEGVIDIKNRAFMGCDSLKSVSLGDYLQIIDDKAFSYCSALERIDLPRHIGSIGTAAFEGCRNLKKISLPNSLKVIENSTFYACTSLKYVKLPNQLEYIDEYAFAYCISILEINIPSNTVINSEAFFECGNRKAS